MSARAETTGSGSGTTRAAVWTLAVLTLAALSLRPPVTAVGPLLDEITADLGLSAAFSGVLTTLPVVCFGVFAFVAPRLRRRWGDERILAGCLALILVGNLARSLDSVGLLLGGTTVLGAGVAIANVALPGLIKRDFADRVPAVTALYTVCLTLGGAGAASVVVPLGRALGSPWRAPFGLLAIPVGIALVVAVLRAARMPPRVRTVAPRVGAGRLWRVPLAWQVTVFMGLQSLGAYVVFGWLPSMAASRGFDASAAGLLLGIQALVQAAGSLAVPPLCRRLRDQRGIAFTVCVLAATGFVGVILGPSPVGVWGFAILLGLAQGASFGLALTLFGLRSPDSDTTAALSGMAQGCGYLIAATGPFAVGLLHDRTGGWTAPLAFILACAAAQLVAGVLAGRHRQVPSVNAEVG